MKTYAARQLIFFGISAILLLAILPLPVDFYIAINLFVALSSGLLVWVAWKISSFVWVIPGLAGVLLYIPVLNQPFDKATWVILDLIFAGVFVVAALNLPGRILEGEK